MKTRQPLSKSLSMLIGSCCECSEGGCFSSGFELFCENIKTKTDSSKIVKVRINNNPKGDPRRKPPPGTHSDSTPTFHNKLSNISISVSFYLTGYYAIKITDRPTRRNKFKILTVDSISQVVSDFCAVDFPLHKGWQCLSLHVRAIKCF